jgi:hypothetical protein
MSDTTVVLVERITELVAAFDGEFFALLLDDTRLAIMA